MWRLIEPRASRLWAHFTPKRWPAAERPYLDLGERRIVWPSRTRPDRAGLQIPDAPPGFAEVVLLPPVGEAELAAKSTLADLIRAAGGMPLDQIPAGGGAARGPASGNVVVDLSGELIFGEAIAALPRSADSILVVPLLPAVSDSEKWWPAIFERHGGASGSTIVGIAPELTPLDRRRLVEALGDDRFEEIHHRAKSALELERAFARAASAAGFLPFFDRPVIPLPPRAARNRSLAAILAEAGERALALGHSEAEAVSLLTAARHVDESERDFVALAREGQLALLPFLSPRARSVIEEFAASGRSEWLAALRVEWLDVEVVA